MSLIFFPMSIGFMSYVDFKKWLCCPVEFKGQGPQASSNIIKSFSLKSAPVLQFYNIKIDSVIHCIKIILTIRYDKSEVG